MEDDLRWGGDPPRLQTRIGEEWIDLPREAIKFTDRGWWTDIDWNEEWLDALAAKLKTVSEPHK